MIHDHTHPIAFGLLLKEMIKKRLLQELFIILNWQYKYTLPEVELLSSGTSSILQTKVNSYTL